MTAQTTTQRTAKHRLAVKERLQRYEAALREIVDGNIWDDASDMRRMAREALNPTDPAKGA
jgi:hypothetical protein